MSRANFLEKLLDGVEVEWKPLGELGDFVRGSGLQKKDFVRTGFPAIHYGQIHTQYGLSADKTFTYISEGLANRLKKAQKNDLLLATTSENDEDVVKPLAWLGEQTAISGDMMLFRHDQNVKYLAYFFHTQAFQGQKGKYITGAKVRRVSSGDLAKIVVPIPCPENPKKSLEIQSEIVRILDAFTAQTAELTAELNAELAARKKQYVYYRDQLLSFEKGEVAWKTLDDVFNIFVGGDVPKEALSGTETEEFCIPVLSNGIGDKAIYGWTNKPKIDEPSLTISARGTIGWTSYRHKPFFPIVRLLVLTQKIQLNMKYAYYFMKSIENNYKIPEAGIPQLTKPMIKDIQIPIPFPNDSKKSLAEQARIVAILDKFDALTNSISEDLPREIELRQKQYEYYRDMLFSFPKPHEVA